jgi:hypothetical protein
LSVGALAGAAVLFGTIIGGNAPALAISDRSGDTYAGDYEGGVTSNRHIRCPSIRCVKSAEFAMVASIYSMQYFFRRYWQ